MRNVLKNPKVNAVCISVFSLFYTAVFIITSSSAGFQSILHAERSSSIFWQSWSDFLAAGQHAIVAHSAFAATVLVVVLLLTRRRPYDEYHTTLLLNCLAASIVLTLIAIALFFLLILNDPTGFVAKFTLFITIHWVTVVLADLTYVLLCRWR